VITEVSLKVLPRPEVETTCHFECDAAAAIETCNRFSARALPISGACHIDEQLALRLSGTERGVAAAVKQIGGDLADANQSTSFWRDLRDWQHPGLRQSDLWRLSLPPATPPLALDGKTVTDWGGAQRWFTPSDELGAANIKAAAKAAGGYAYAVRGGNVEQGVTPPEGALQTIHTRLKDAFDPARIFNPGRVFATI
jgi:glycolate oxidase FAD binding subunit